MSHSKRPKADPETSLERIMREELERRGLSFESQYPTRSGFIIDFAFSDKRIGIECDGEMWHKPGNRRDRYRDRILKRGGWRIIRFTGTERMDNVSSCVDRITELLG